MQKLSITEYILIAIFFLLPFGLWGENVHYGHAHSLILACLVLIGSSLPSIWMRLFIYYVALWLSYITMGLFLGTLTSTTSSTLILIDGSIWFVLGSIVFLIIYYSRIKTDIFFNLFCITALIQAVLGIGQHFGWDIVFDIARKFVTVKSELLATASVGTLGNNNFLAAYLAIALPFFFRKKWVYFIPVIILSLYFTHTRAAIIAAIIGSAYYGSEYLWKRYQDSKLPKYEAPYILTGFIGAVLLVLYSYWLVEGRGVADRPAMWLDGIRQVMVSWSTLLFGLGPGAEWKVGDKLHNEFIMTLFNFGAVGLVLLFGYIVTISRTNRMLFTAFIIICIDAVGNHVLHLVPTAVLLVIPITALIEREKGDGLKECVTRIR